jgi:hypothetical protein
MATVSKSDPHTTAPVAVSIVLAEPVFGVLVIAPFPIVGMNVEFEPRAVVVTLRMPAVTVIVANDLG